MDKEFMKEALRIAESAGKNGEIPVGAVLVRDGKIIATGANTKEKDGRATRHAEINAIESSGEKYLDDCTLYVTLEPCPMCAGAIVNARVGRLVFGASDSKGGACGGVCDIFAMPFNHRPIVKSGVLEVECADIIKKYFEKLR